MESVKSVGGLGFVPFPGPILAAQHPLRKRRFSAGPSQAKPSGDAQGNSGDCLSVFVMLKNLGSRLLRLNHN